MNITEPFTRGTVIGVLWSSILGNEMKHYIYIRKWYNIALVKANDYNRAVKNWDRNSYKNFSSVLELAVPFHFTIRYAPTQEKKIMMYKPGGVCLRPGSALDQDTDKDEEDKIRKNHDDMA